MKALVTGLVLIAISGAALIWHLATRNATPATVVSGPARTTHCMVWKAQRGHGTVWLCGSFHALQEEDYPLPPPYLKAFADSAILVTESPHDSTGAAERRENAVAAGKLPDGDTLDKHLSEPVWKQLQDTCAALDLNPAVLLPMKPWQAALHLTSYAMQKQGYKPALGLEARFTSDAGKRQLASLEKAEAQLSPLNSLDAATQESMVQHAAGDAKNARKRLSDLSEAWHEGSVSKLVALSDADLSDLPAVKKVLLEDRHAVWLPQVEKYLDGDVTVMVLVGARHLCGAGSLIESLEAKGASVTQMEYQTTRPAP